jgi:hypothetical protein
MQIDLTNNCYCFLTIMVYIKKYTLPQFQDIFLNLVTRLFKKL